MNWIRKTFIFIAFSIVFLFAFTANKSAVDKIPSAKNNSSFSVDGIHSSVFIQPQASSIVTPPHKTADFSASKYFETLLVVIPDLKISTTFTLFANQDINRCEMVSLLLFPFHFFW
ncbi:MAG: hypothetical protein C0430_03205 [Flavobacterium sp.]|nr:hypothetical protein [Flavobacterium sp.]